MSFFNFFRRKRRNPFPEHWQMPVAGHVLPLSEVPDEAFASGSIGKGFAIEPYVFENQEKNILHSPVDGKISAIFPTRHAIGITAANGLEILIHVGIDSVKMKGKGFDLKVDVGDQVTMGQMIMTVDFANLEHEIPSVITLIVFPELDPKSEVVVTDNRPQLK